MSNPEINPNPAELPVPPAVAVDKSQPEHPPVPETPEAPVVAAPVESAVLHSRGGVILADPSVQPEVRKTGKNTKFEDIPEKGDIYIHPDATAKERRLVIDGVRKDNDDTIVLFTPESQPDVRTEPGEKIRQLPLHNFRVKSEGYEPKRIYKERLNQTAEEFGDIWNASQELLVKVLAQGDNEEDSDDAKQEKDRVIEILQNIGNLEDEWDELGEDESRAKYAGALSLLKRSKKLVGELPDSLVASNSLLRKIQKEYEVKGDDRADDHGDQKRNSTQRGRSREKVREGKKDKGGKVGERRGQNVRNGTVGGDTVSDGEGGRVDEASEGRLDQGKEKEGDESGEAELSFWINDIHTQQKEREELNRRIGQKGLMARWGSAMKAVNQEVERFAQKEFKYIDGELGDIWDEYARRQTQLQRERKPEERQKKAEELDQWSEKILKRLQRYSETYQKIVQTGREVAKEKSQRSRETVSRKDRGPRRSRGREMQTLENKTWNELAPTVQEAIRIEMESMKERCLTYYDAACVVLATKGISPEEQHHIIASRLIPVLTENVHPLLVEAQVSLTQSQVQMVAEKFAQQLLAGKVEQIEYGGK